jgi:hypothetical protein
MKGNPGKVRAFLKSLDSAPFISSAGRRIGKTVLLHSKTVQQHRFSVIFPFPRLGVQGRTGSYCHTSNWGKRSEKMVF